VSRTTIEWAAAHRYPYLIFDSQLPITKQVFEIYREAAGRHGYEAGPEHLGYVFRLHVDDTEERAYEVGRKLIEGVGNHFVDGSNGAANIWAQNLPGFNARKMSGFLPTIAHSPVTDARGIVTDETELTKLWEHRDVSPEEHVRRRYKIWDSVLARKGAVVGTPETVVSQLREIFSVIRPGNVFFVHGDGDMTHEDAMRHIRYMREYVIPALREISTEYELPGAFEIDPRSGLPLNAKDEHVSV
jgi:alkanesulfonate monooxygenase SsuD/methylene tetrahydromethanopterin reductase-like flavin-dependent oxidoreductase (luciferase family)